MAQIYNLSWSINISKQFSFNAALYPVFIPTIQDIHLIFHTAPELW